MDFSKILYGLIILVVISGFRIKTENYCNVTQNSNHGEELLENDFLAFAESSRLNALEANIISFFNIYDPAINKLVSIDAEELVEFNFDFFVPGLNQILEKRGFSLEVKLTGDYQRTNNIIINGKVIQLYTAKELESWDYWDSGPRNFFREVNQQLTAANINEQFYLLYDANDLRAFLLTEVQFEIITDKYGANTRESPYRP